MLLPSLLPSLFSLKNAPRLRRKDPGVLKKNPSHLFENGESLADGQLGGNLGVGLGLVAEVEVGLELVVVGDAEELPDGGLDGGDGSHVLEVGAQALDLEGGPDEDLGDAAGVVGPLLEHVGGRLVCLLRGLDGLTTVPEENLMFGNGSATRCIRGTVGCGGPYRAIGALEGLETGSEGLPDTGGGQDGLGSLDDDIPELLVLLAEKKADAGGLCVVGGRGEGEDLADDLLDAAVGDGRGILKTVDGAAVLGGLEPLVGVDLRGRHVVG